MANKLTAEDVAQRIGDGDLTLAQACSRYKTLSRSQIVKAAKDYLRQVGSELTDLEGTYETLTEELAIELLK